MADDLISANLSENIDSLSLGSKELLTNDTTSEEHAVTTHNEFDDTQEIFPFEYGMNHKHRGLAIIFNQLNFKNLPSMRRDGTEKDVEELKKCLPYLGFQEQHIIVENDLTKSEILNYSNKLVREKEDILKNSDCIAIFILSHGLPNHTIIAYDDSYGLYELVEQYTAKNLKQLTNKPKLFFVEACRGDKKDDGVWVNHYTPMSGDWCDSGLWELELRPRNADVFIGHSSYHDYKSFRNGNGSWYIQDLCQSIRNYRDDNLLETTDIPELLTYTSFLTSKRVTKNKESEIKKQCPTFNSGLSGKLCFKSATQ